MLTTHGVAEGEWNGNEWIQYRWSAKVKDSDVHYWLYLEDLTQLEKEGENIQQEQPEAIDGVVHHALGTHWIVVNQEQVSARLKQFPEGTEVEILIEARKEE